MIKDKINQLPNKKIKTQMKLMHEWLPEMTTYEYNELLCTFYLCGIFGSKHWTKADNWHKKETYGDAGTTRKGWITWANHDKDPLRQIPKDIALDIINLNVPKQNADVIT